VIRKGVGGKKKKEKERTGDFKGAEKTVRRWKEVNAHHPGLLRRKKVGDHE